MREIKFRAWDKTNKAMFDWEAMQYWRMGEFVYMLDKYDFLQYTGLKDKNGKEIYAQDIIKDEEDCNFQIEWDYHTAGFYLQSTEDNEYNEEMNYILNNKVEIIGNIYENPELLK